MNKQKGFTLIEIIGVVTILSLILIVAVPSLTKTLKRNEEKKYNDYIENLNIAAENYAVNKLKKGQFFEDGKDYNYISLGQLIDDGYIKDTIKNPENNKILARDSRIKVSKKVDGTFEYDVQEYYNNTSDYNNSNLIIHYDAVEYNPNNVFKSLTNEIDYDYSSRGQWTEDGIYFDKNKPSNIKQKLNNEYSTDKITVSFNVESLDELGTGGSDYTFVVQLLNGNYHTVRTACRKNVCLFYGSGKDAVFVPKTQIKSNKNYTITFVQDGLAIRKIYINGILEQAISNLSLSNIVYNNVTISPDIYNLKLNNALVYNRVLSDSEIQELYQLDKERFGE